MIKPKLVSLAISIFLAAGNFVLAQETEGLGPNVERPVVSPDGTKLLFESNAGKSIDIWIADRDGRSARPLILLGGSDERDADWSPDGSRIVFASNKGGSWNIWTASKSGTDLRQLTTGTARNTHPRFSPDGTTLLFLSARSGKDEIWLMNATGGTARPVGFISLRINAPAWSPDSQEIVYSGCSVDACNLYIVAKDGSTFSRVTAGAFQDWTPAWSQSGIAFASNRGGNGFGLWIVRPDGSQLQQIASQGFDPRWDRTEGLVFVRTSDDDDVSLADVWGRSPAGTSSRLTRISGLLIHGDVNGDGSTNCNDLALVRVAYGKKQGQVGFDSRADIDADGLVNLRDLTTVSRNMPTGTVCR